MPTQVITLIVVGAIMFLVIGGLAFLSHYYTLDGIKSKTVGDGQHGTARWATKQEIRQTYAHVPFEPELWRKGEHLPEKQGLVLGCEGPKDHVTALVDTDDIHAMVTAASGAGKTAFFLYPNIEYALASGMSFLCTDIRRLRPGQSDRGGTVQIFGQPDGNERQYLPRKKRSQPVPPDDGASPHDPG